MSQSWLDKMAAQHAACEEEEEEEEEKKEEIKQAPKQEEALNRNQEPEHVQEIREKKDEKKDEEPAEQKEIIEDKKDEKSNSYEGPSSKELQKYLRNVNDALKAQEASYVDPLILLRQKLTVALNLTSAPLQNCGPIGKASTESKSKYTSLANQISEIKPRFVYKKKQESQ